MKQTLFAAPLATLTVSELCIAIRRSLENLYAGPIRVVGEVAKFNLASSGHLHFELKDRQAVLSCICYRSTVATLGLKPPLADGLAVEVIGRVSAYLAKSQYELIVDDIVPVGYGDLHQRFELLKEKLRAQGLFDAGRKRPIPKFIQSVAIVTSREAAALRDFIATAKRRGAHVKVTLVHAPVQGAQAAPELARAIRFAGSLDVDAVVIARGGGSIEDLWSFNTEMVARAIARSPKPVISAVGHETDFTIADFVADLRVATPTAAAELVAAERTALLDRIERAQVRLSRGFQRMAETAIDRFDRARLALARTQRAIVDEPMRRVDEVVEDLARLDPRRALAELAVRVAEWQRRLKVGVKAASESRRAQLELLGARVVALGPQNTLARGYALVYDAAGGVLTDSAAVNVGELIDVRLRRGSLTASVREKRTQDGQDER